MNVIKNFIKTIAGFAGVEVVRKRNRPPKVRPNSMEEGLRYSKNIGLRINTIIDVGAASGTWSVAANDIWPECTFLMFEPLVERKELLSSLCQVHKNFHFVNAAAGSENEIVKFFVSEDLDGSGVATRETDLKLRDVNITRIDEEVTSRKLKGPYLIKLDTHGFEVPILRGCSSIFAEVELFIVECYGFQIATNSLLFWEMCRHMDEYGYRLFNIVDVMNRPLDGSFWQCDAFFLRKNNPLFNRGSYK